MEQLKILFEKIRKDFPAIHQKVHDHSLVYLDSAATALKPQSVIDRMIQFYSFETANVHRGAHYLSDQATEHFEEARLKVQEFINAEHSSEIVFVKGATEAINLVAHSYSERFLNEGDEILVTEMEHHANFVPWQMMAKNKKIKFNVVKVAAEGELDWNDFQSQLTKKTKLVAVTACSNTLGTINNIEKISKMVHAVGAHLLVDGAQSITVNKTDVRKMDCDFFVFSGHKIFGPYGVGALYAKKNILDEMPPYQGGGSMIHQVGLETTTYNDAPFRFEAGTPNISGVIGLKSALEYIQAIGFDRIHQWESYLLELAYSELKKIEQIEILGFPEKSKILFSERAPIISFNLKGAHHSDVGHIVDQQGVAVRVGHHCTKPLMKKMNISGTVRASFSIYNDEEDVVKFVRAVKKAQEILL